jgi:hypothetical protein
VNKKKIHKIIIKLITGICLVVYFTTSGIIGFKPVNAITNKNIEISMTQKFTCNYTVQSVKKDMLIGKVSGDDSSHIWFTNRLNELAKAHNKKLVIVSGYRSYEKQQEMFNNSDRSGKFVARAGCSRHNAGLAVDVSDWATKLTNKQLEQFGLYKPMEYENWHIEPIETRGLSTKQIIAKYGLPTKTTILSYINNL